MSRKGLLDREFESKFILGFDNIDLPVDNLEDLNSITVTRDANSLTEVRIYKIKDEEDYNKLVEELTKYYNTTGIKLIDVKDE